MVKLTAKFEIILISLTFIIKYLNAQNQIDCSTYKDLWVNKKYQYNDELTKLSIIKSTTDICPKSTCCDKNMQNEMVGVSQLKLKSTAQLHIKGIINFLSNNSETFNDYFQNNLDLSKSQLHKMFLNTYSNNYQLNQPFFFEFYNKLKLYMAGKLQNIDLILDTFFHEMAEKILTMMVLVKKDPETINCLKNNFLKLNPYQNIDKTIIAGFKNAYPVARMFVNALQAAQDVFMELYEKKMMPSLECAEEHAKAFHCSLCSTIEMQPCVGLCKSIMGKCFGSFNHKELAKLNKSWKKLLIIVEKVSKKLRHPFNYPEFNKNLHVKISDAIMNVHNFYPTVREKILGNCKNQISRTRRSGNENSNQYFENSPKTSSEKSKDLPEIIDKFTVKIPEISQHLQKQKIIICSNMDLPKAENQCWNGLESTSSFKPEQKDKSQLKNQKIDPIVQSSIRRLNEIALVLNNLLTDKIKDPDVFKIKFVKKPKKPEIPRTRPFRVPESSIEGSGGSDAENVKPITNPKIKQELPPAVTEKPTEIFEGSGDKKKSENKDKIQPAFPEIPQTNENPPPTPLPKEPIKKPTITDDEDMTPAETENDKDKINKPFNGKKAPIEGSGSPDLQERSKEPIKMFTTTTLPIPVTEARKPFKDRQESKENILPEGSGQNPDDENPSNKPDESNSQMPVIHMQKTTQPPVDEITTESSLSLNELPGEIPHEIWIPRVVDYDSHDKKVNDPNNSTSLNVNLLTMAIQLTISVVSIYLSKLM